MVLIIRSNRISRVPPYFSCTFYVTISTTGVSPSLLVLPKTFVYRNFKLCTSGSSNFARHYSQNRCYFLFLCLLRYFNSTGIASLRIHALLACGFSHSDSSGSLLTYSSPKRFAVRRVLLRLLVPRHPLCALCSLTFFCNSNSTKFLSTFQRSLLFFLRNFTSLSKLYTTNKLIFFLVV